MFNVNVGKYTKLAPWIRHGYCHAEILRKDDWISLFHKGPEFFEIPNQVPLHQPSLIVI